RVAAICLLSDFVPIRLVANRAINEVVEVCRRGRAVEVAGRDADKGAGEAAMRLMATALIRKYRRVEHRTDRLQFLSLKGIEELQLAAADRQRQLDLAFIGDLYRLSR